MPLEDYISLEIEKIKQNYPLAVDGMSDDSIFGLVCLSFFYKDAEFQNSFISDHFTDGSDDGGIDSIISDEINEQLIFIQDKNISSLSNTQDVIDMLTGMHQSIQALVRNEASHLNEKVRRIYDSQRDSEDSYEKCLTIFINCDVSDTRRQRIDDEISSNDELSQYGENIKVFFKNDISQEIIRKIEPPRSVELDRVKIDEASSFIEYSSNSNEGIIVNISALDVKRLYNQYKDKGLFERNFRYYIPKKKIDDQIKQSLNRQNKDNFWFLNNGMIIGCSSFHKDGNRVDISNFSIVNGCQTASLIGRFFEGEDFFFPCKIISSNDDNFIAKVAQASNTQKAIVDRDLKSNKEEMRSLQRKLKINDPKVYMKIKNGEKFRTIEGVELTQAQIRNLENWEKIENLDYGKYVLSGLLQQPGFARSTPGKIWEGQTYASIFLRRTFDKNTTYDLLKIFSLYQEFKNIDFMIESNSEGYIYDSDPHRRELLQFISNGYLTIPASVILFIKIKRELVDLSAINTDDGIETQITADNLNGKLFKEVLTDDYKKQLFDLFFDIASSIKDKYITLASQMDIKNESVFLKSNTNYHKHIQTHFRSTLYSQRNIEEFQQRISKLFD